MSAGIKGSKARQRVERLRVPGWAVRVRKEKKKKKKES